MHLAGEGVSACSREAHLLRHLLTPEPGDSLTARESRRPPADLREALNASASPTVDGASPVADPYRLCAEMRGGSVLLSCLLVRVSFCVVVRRTTSSGFGVRGSRFEVRGSRFGVRGSRFGVRGSGFAVQGSGGAARLQFVDSNFWKGFRVRGSGFEVHCTFFAPFFVLMCHIQ